MSAAAYSIDWESDVRRAIETMLGDAHVRVGAGGLALLVDDGDGCGDVRGALVITRDPARIGALLDGGAVEAICWPRDADVLVARARRALARLDERRGDDTGDTIFEAYPDPLYVQSADGRVTCVNRALADLLGTPPHEIVGRPLADGHATATGTWRELTPRFPGAGATEATFTDHRGRVKTYLTVRSPLRVREGASQFLTVAIDVTRRKEAEKELGRFKRIFELAEALIMMLDDTGHIRHASSALALLLGYSPAQLVGLDASSLVHPFDWERAHQALGRHLEPRRYEARYRHADGSYRSLAWTVVRDAVTNESYAVASDLTAARAAQDAAMRAQATAVEASRAKSQFLANMSHELRTPMNGVLGMLGLVLDSDLTAEQRESLEDAKSSAEGLLAIVNDILDISKIEAGKLVVEPLPCRLRPFLDDVMRIFARRAAEKGVALEVIIGADVPHVVTTDALRLRQILVNLIGNALKFTTIGRILVTVERQEEDADVLSISVRDTGCGILEDKLDHVFGAFAQADASSTRRHQGTGLGLSVSAELARLLGGIITVTSQLGKGSCFTLTIRAPRASDNGLDVPSARPSAVVSALVFGERPRVLVAEDNPVNAKVVRRLLEKLGCDVVLVEDGARAVDWTSSSKFDLVLMDMQMPTMDGLEATRLIRAHNKRRMPIVALTANAMKADEAACLAAGMDGHIAKPIDPAQLRSLVDSIRARGAQRAPGDEASTADQTPASTAECAVHLESALARCAGDEELLRELVIAFRESWRESAYALKSSVDAGDAQATVGAAHRLKGALLAVSARRATDLARMLESDARVPDLSRASRLVAELFEELPRIEAELSAVVA